MVELFLVHDAPDDSLLSLHSEALMAPLRQRMIEDRQIRNLSPRTIESYTDHVGRFAKYFGPSPEHLGPKQIRQHQIHLVHEKKATWRGFNQTVCALRFPRTCPCMNRPGSFEVLNSPLPPYWYHCNGP